MGPLQWHSLEYTFIEARVQACNTSQAMAGRSNGSNGQLQRHQEWLLLWSRDHGAEGGLAEGMDDGKMKRHMLNRDAGKG